MIVIVIVIENTDFFLPLDGVLWMNELLRSSVLRTKSYQKVSSFILGVILAHSICFCFNFCFPRFIYLHPPPPPPPPPSSSNTSDILIGGYFLFALIILIHYGCHEACIVILLLAAKYHYGLVTFVHANKETWVHKTITLERPFPKSFPSESEFYVRHKYPSLNLKTTFSWFLEWS